MRLRQALLVTGVGMALAACGGPEQLAGGVTPIATTEPPVTSGASTPPATPARQFTEPTGYRDVNWTSQPDPNQEGSGALFRVPEGWAETKRDTYWSDYLDPTGQVRLRVNATASLTGQGVRQSTAQAAGDELSRLREAAGFKLIGQRTLPPGGQDGMGATEIVYQFSLDGQTVQCTYRFIGTADVTQAQLGVYYPASAQHGAENVLDTVNDSLLFAG